MGNGSRIKDIPRIQKALESARQITDVEMASDVLVPLLKLLGADAAGFQDSVARAVASAGKVQELSSVPDEFNEFFSRRGWIMYDVMNMDVAKQAVEKARLGFFVEAEQILVDYYDPRTVEIKLALMKGVRAFRPRWALARKAFIDYREQRYHACVPVVLALLDGMVNEVHEDRRGFFARDTDLTAWDTVAGHSSGLNSLARILRKRRETTVTEEISVPYRHGILHGNDLGYDNPLVAAKAWAALFATREWALSVEQAASVSLPGEREDPYSKAVLQGKRVKEPEDLRGDRPAVRRPRNPTIGVDLPASGAPEDYAWGWPERRLAEYLTYWQRGNYGYAALCLHPRHHEARNDPGLVREVLGFHPLTGFKFLSIKDTDARTEIETELELTQFGKCATKVVRMQLIYTHPEGNTVTRDEPGGTWQVFTWPGL